MKTIYLLLFLTTFTVVANGQLRSDFDRKMNAPVEGFTIINNIHYVGTSDLAVFLITTPKGHILIDAGFKESVPTIESNIKKLGFKIEDIKVLLTNHTHPDHAGGLATIKEKSGARLYATNRQKKQLQRGGKKDFRFGNDMTFDEVEVDRTIKDQIRFSYGGMTFLPIFTPGHTKGCVSFMTTTQVDGANYQVMFAGSLSSLDYDFVSNKKYKKHAKEFIETFSILRTLKVDIFLTSHAQFFGVEEKRKLLLKKPARNPFFDPAGYSAYVAASEKSFRKKLKAQKGTGK